MIRASLLKTEGTVEIAVTGHAGTAPAGRDLLCAAVSALCETLERGLGRYDPESERALGEGAFHYRGNPGIEASALIWTFAQGLKELSRDHPRHLKWTEAPAKEA